MKFTIRSGEFKHPISIERYTTIKDKDKLTIKMWSNLFDTRAKILNVRGDEFYTALSNSARVDVTFYIRFNRNIEVKSSDRIKYKGKFYDIIYLNNIEEADKYLEIKSRCVE